MAAESKKKAKSTDELLTFEGLDAIKAELTKDLGADILWGNDTKFKLVKLPLGIATLDAALNGGFAFGRMALLVGEFSAGKTLIAMLAIKAAQAQGLVTAFIDIEKTWVPDWAIQLGIDPEKVLIIRPKSGEDAFNAAVSLVKKNIPLLVIDSLAAMVSEAELAPEDDELLQKQFIGGTAKLVGRGLKLINNENKNSLVICINQLREKPGVVYGNPETMPGGKAPPYYAWQLVRVRRGAFIEDNGKKLGYRLKVTITKNKQGAPFTEAEVPFYYTGEIDEIAGLVEQAIEIGAITNKGANYFISKLDKDTGELIEQKVYGKRNLLEHVKQNQDVRDHIISVLNGLEVVEV